MDWVERIYVVNVIYILDNDSTMPKASPTLSSIMEKGAKVEVWSNFFHRPSIA